MIKHLLPALSGLFALSAPLHAEDLHVRGDRLFVPVSIGSEQVEALLDSGAEVTVIDRAFAARHPIGEGQEVDAHGTGAQSVKASLVENQPIGALGRDFTLPVVAVMDLSEVGNRLLGGPLPVVLGREVFDAGRLAIDIEEGTIDWLGEGESPAGERVALTSAHGIESIPVRFGATQVHADFDLGNGTGLLISKVLADRLGLEPAGIEPGGGIGGAKGRAVVYVPELTVAGHSFRNVRAHVDDDAQVDANVGVAQLRAFRIVTDFPNGAVWLELRKD